MSRAVDDTMRRTLRVCTKCGHCAAADEPAEGRSASDCPRCSAPTVDLGNGRRAAYVPTLSLQARIQYVAGGWERRPRKWAKYRDNGRP